MLGLVLVLALVLALGLGGCPFRKTTLSAGNTLSSVATISSSTTDILFAVSTNILEINMLTTLGRTTTSDGIQVFATGVTRVAKPIFIAIFVYATIFMGSTRTGVVGSAGTIRTHSIDGVALARFCYTLTIAT